MKAEYLVTMLALWMAILFPVSAGAEGLGILRLSQMQGDVQVQSKEADEWLPAAVNLPLQAGDRLWVPREAWAQVESREGNVVRLDAGSSLEILAVGENSLQMYLSQGQAYLNFKRLEGSTFQLDTPVASVRVHDGSTFNVALVNNGNTEVSVFRGAVYAENRNGEVRVGAGKMLAMDDELPTLMALAPPNDWERWNKEWDESLAGGEESEQYLPAELSGYGGDLDRSGTWIETSEYGYVWTPTVGISADWAPYRHGRWVWIGGDYVWIAREPWGWAPYHYGRWAHISSHGWCWVPPPRNEVFWGPGYVSWVATENNVAWVPLAPGEIYYGHGNYGPHSVNIVNADIYAVIPGRNFRNAHVPDAVTVIHRDTFLTGRHHDLGRPENPFLRAPISIGRPMIEPGRVTRMPIIKPVPKGSEPPPHIRSFPGRMEDGARQMVREPDRSGPPPAGMPQPLPPAIRMNTDPDVKRNVEQGPPKPSGRQEMLEHTIVPRQYRGQPAINREDIQPPPVQRQPQAVPPPAAVREKPEDDDAKKQMPAFRGPQFPPAQPLPSGQNRSQPAMNRENIQPPPAQRQPPQVAPPPAPPAPPQRQLQGRPDPEALKRFQQQAADQKKAEQDDGDKRRQMLEQQQQQPQQGRRSPFP